ncbi:uncharacterized protein MYCFIDRAFT_170935 [Pseudocercospora fijiensis CIRAD86]|uniref:3'-5' exonuclease domain-containing protein n=1 Tax=Pseudocercospora fijiensis (strain CIRAD86) TaxID=383855 RepID=N1QBI1_PSEFD|nr:uncharacterized protein MYCFIDRAFT_170935 [Pseudocercospora fijiensis CIRAD86]EME89476.1 hypothetical protein MYCFIDRAFT_170935 [Pseudocercospora fijiensis CIRAD86]
MSRGGANNMSDFDFFPIDSSFEIDEPDFDTDDEVKSPTSFARLRRFRSNSTSNIATQAEKLNTDIRLPHSSSSSSKWECKPPSTGLARNATGDPTDERLLLPMKIYEGRRVSRDGKVLDHNGDVFGEVVIGDIQDCAGEYIREEGKIFSATGILLGRIKIVPGNAARDALADWMDTLPPVESSVGQSESDEGSPLHSKSNSPEAMLSTNALKCAEMAKNSERIRTSTFLSLQGEAIQRIEFEKMERKINSLSNQLRSIENDIPAHMHPKLYERLSFGEVTATYNRILAAIAEQRTWRVSEGGSEATGVWRPAVKLSHPKLSVVNGIEMVSDMMDGILAALKVPAPYHLALSLQGKPLGRGGDISIVTVYVPSFDYVYLLDVAVLGAASFNCSGTGTNSSTDLRRILQTPDVKKLIFDCRLPSIALHDGYGIKLDGVIDAQLAFCATRTKPKERKQLNVLTKAALHATSMDKEDQKTWKSDVRWGNVCLVLGKTSTENAKRICAEDSDQWHKVERLIAYTKAQSGFEGCNARPIPQLLARYYVAQVILLGPLVEYCTTHPVWNEALATQNGTTYLKETDFGMRRLRDGRILSMREERSSSRHFGIGLFHCA